MNEGVRLPIQAGFAINPEYALLVGEVVMIYARFEGNVVDIIGFHKKGFRSDYYCGESVKPSELLTELHNIKARTGEADLSQIIDGFRFAIDLRNAIGHAVPCGGNSYDVLHFQQGQKDERKRRNPFICSVFEYDFLKARGEELSRMQSVASDYFYQLRARNDAGESFGGDPC